MIEITTKVDIETNSVTWALNDLGPEHEMDGKLCHAVDGDLERSPLPYVLRILGYQYVCTVERPGPSWATEPRKAHYWLPPEPVS